MTIDHPEHGFYYFSVKGYTSQHKSMTGYVPVDVVEKAAEGDENARKTIYTIAINIAYDEDRDEGGFPRVQYDDITLTRLPFEEWTD